MYANTWKGQYKSVKGRHLNKHSPNENGFPYIRHLRIVMIQYLIMIRLQLDDKLTLGRDSLLDELFSRELSPVTVPLSDRGSPVWRTHKTYKD